MNYVSLLKKFFQLRNNASMTRKQVLALQEKKLRALLYYAWDNSQWHRQRMEEAGITRAQLAVLPLSAFPTMTKQDLLGNFDQLVTVPGLHQADLRRFDEEQSIQQRSFQNQYHVVHSSGSTGTPGYFVYDNAAWDQMLLGIIRGALWGMSTGSILKLLLSGPRILYIAATDGRYGGAMAVGDGVDGLHARQLHLDINTPLSVWVEKIAAFRPNFIIGYPSAIKILGDLIDQGAVEVDSLRVVSCGEPLGPGLRRYLERSFGCEVVNFYGASESLALGVEMGEEEGMLLFDDMNMIEVEDGQMYLTSLYNFVQPLIRYRITDQLTLKEPKAGDPCAFTRANILLGRNEDILWFDDDKGGKEFLHPLAIEGFCIEGLKDYQFHPTGPTGFEMTAEAAPQDRPRIQSEITDQMSHILAEKGLGHIQFSVCFVDNILPDPITGKKKLIRLDGAERGQSA